jgi:hypothetical protein
MGFQAGEAKMTMVNTDFARDNFAVLGIFVEAVSFVLGPFSEIEQATRRAMLSNSEEDLQEAVSQFDALDGRLRRRVADRAQERAREVVSRSRGAVRGASIRKLGSRQTPLTKPGSEPRPLNFRLRFSA